jgi:hypothetical protein
LAQSVVAVWDECLADSKVYEKAYKSVELKVEQKDELMAE